MIANQAVRPGATHRASVYVYTPPLSLFLEWMDEARNGRDQRPKFGLRLTRKRQHNSCALRLKTRSARRFGRESCLLDFPVKAVVARTDADAGRHAQQKPLSWPPIRPLARRVSRTRFKSRSNAPDHEPLTLGKRTDSFYVDPGMKVQAPRKSNKQVTRI